jgi:hypothetical protein
MDLIRIFIGSCFIEVMGQVLDILLTNRKLDLTLYFAGVHRFSKNVGANS